MNFTDRETAQAEATRLNRENNNNSRNGPYFTYTVYNFTREP